MMPWTKLDVTLLLTGADKYDKMVRKLGSRLVNAESRPPYVKLRTTITGFKDSLPLIQLLKIPAV